MGAKQSLLNITPLGTFQMAFRVFFLTAALSSYRVIFKWLLKRRLHRFEGTHDVCYTVL